MKIDKLLECKRLGAGATKEDIRNAHRVKMAAKKIIRDYNSKTYADTSPVFANISVNHPDSGALARNYNSKNSS